jgi:hypothetical protein
LTLAQAAPSSIRFLKDFGLEKEGAETEYDYIRSKKDLNEFYLSFVRSLTGVAMAHLSVFSGVIADGRTTTSEEVNDLLSTLIESTGLPGALLVTSVGKYLMKKLNDRERNLTLQRLTRTFPSISSLEWIETLGRKVTLFLEDDLREKREEQEEKKGKQGGGGGVMEGLKGMKKKIEKNVEWLQDGRNKCLGERMGEEISAVLLDAIMKNDPAEAVDEVRVLVKLMEWTLEGRGGPFSVDQVKNCLVPVSSSSLSSSAPIPPSTKSVVCRSFSFE